MELFIIIIPIIACGILFWKFRDNACWWEYLIILGGTALLYLITHSIMVSINENDTEYYGSYVTSTTYYEPWDEMVWVTKTREVSDGHGGTTTESYEEREREYHDARYTYTDNCSKCSHEISYGTYKKMSKKLGTEPQFKDMHRDYHRIDGDAYVQKYDNTVNHCYSLTELHMYKNKVKASKYSIFKYANMSKDEIKKNKLFEYPDISHGDQNPIIGKKVSKSAEDSIRFINGFYGKSKQFRTYILIFDTNDAEVAEMQKAYWDGGNKNEFVVCLGCKGDSVMWCRPFSWCDNPILEIGTRDFFMTNRHLDIGGYASYLMHNMDKWKRKEFKDFNYLNVQVTTGEKWIILIIILLYNIGTCVWIATNELDNE